MSQTLIIGALCGIIGGLSARYFNVPGGAFIGSMFGCAVYSATIDGGVVLPSNLRLIIQIIAGIMIGTIFVVTLVMGDFITVRFMSGSQSANVGRLISNDIALLQYPSASATAVILLITVLMVIGTLLRFVDIRKEL